MSFAAGSAWAKTPSASRLAPGLSSDAWPDVPVQGRTCEDLRRVVGYRSVPGTSISTRWPEALGLDEHRSSLGAIRSLVRTLGSTTRAVVRLRSAW